MMAVKTQRAVPADAQRSVPGAKFNLGVAVLALWMVGGLFVDGWAHVNLDSATESFFTPWHAILYSGFLALVIWMGSRLLRRRDLPLAQRMPDGYALGYLGAVLFGLGGVGDGIWHQLLGIEVGIDALLSPTHLILLTGGLLLLTSPLRGAWRAAGDAPTLSEFLPALASITFTAALLAFFFAYAWGGLDLTPAGALPEAALLHGTPGHLEAETAVAAAIVSRLVTTTLLIGPWLLLLRRWHPPFGTATVLFTVVSALAFALADGASPLLLVGPLLAGLVADVLVRHLALGPTARQWQIHVTAAGVGGLLWAGHFTVMASVHGLGWPPELWGGAIYLSALAALGLAVLAFPPARPVRRSEGSAV